MSWYVWLDEQNNIYRHGSQTERDRFARKLGISGQLPDEEKFTTEGLAATACWSRTFNSNVKTQGDCHGAA